MLYGGMRESEAGAEIEIKVRQSCRYMHAADSGRMMSCVCLLVPGVSRPPAFNQSPFPSAWRMVDPLNSTANIQVSMSYPEDVDIVGFAALSRKLFAT